MKNLRIRFYIGAGSTPGVTVAGVEATVESRILKTYPAFTLLRGDGAWTDRSGTVVREEAVVAEVLIDRTLAEASREAHRVAEEAHRVAGDLARELQQDAVGLTVEFVEYLKFVAPSGR